MQNVAYLSLIPPLIVLALGFATRRIILALVCGIISAGLIAANCELYNTATIVYNNIWFNLSQKQDNIFICIFLLMLGIIVTLMRNSGGVYAYGNFVKKFLEDKRSTESASILLSLCLIIDDYLSCLTVGVVMRPLTDLYKIARVKLAFLVDTLAAPLAIICPFSSWVAATLGFLRASGVSTTASSNTLILASPLSIYGQILPFMFYSLLVLVATIFIVRRSISFGTMGRFETTAQQTGDVLVGHPTDPAEKHYFDIENFNSTNTHIVDFLAPLAILLVAVISGMLFSGDYYLFDGNNGLVNALQNAIAATGLFVGGGVALSCITMFLLIRKKLFLNKLTSLYIAGIKLMLPAIIILLLAWTLGDMLQRELGTGVYLAELLSNSINIIYLPVLLFILATTMAFAIGSSWGTAAMLFPIIIPMVLKFYGLENNANLEQLPIMLPVLGAVLSGAVAGDHLSPISDTTVMASTSTGTPQMDHVRTQLSYGIPFVLATCVSFLLIGLLLEHLGVWISIAIAVTIPLTVLLGAFMCCSIKKRPHAIYIGRET